MSFLPSLNCTFVFCKKKLSMLCFRSLWYRRMMMYLKETQFCLQGRKMARQPLAPMRVLLSVKILEKKDHLFLEWSFSEILPQCFDTLLFAFLLSFKKLHNSVYWSKLAASFSRFLAACIPDGLDKTIRYYIKGPILEVSAWKIFQVMMWSFLPGHV